MPDPLLDQLRQPSTPPMRVDRAAVIEGGRRRVRRRALTRAGFAAAVVAALAWPAAQLWNQAVDATPAEGDLVLTVHADVGAGERVEFASGDAAEEAVATVVDARGRTVAQLGEVSLADPARLPDLVVAAGQMWAVAVTPSAMSRPVLLPNVDVGLAASHGQAPSGARVTVFRFTDPVPQTVRFPLAAFDGELVVASTGEKAQTFQPYGAEGLTVVLFRELGFFGTLEGGTPDVGALEPGADALTWARSGMTIPGVTSRGTTVVLLPDGSDHVSVVPRFDFQSFDGNYESWPMPGGGVVLFLGLTEVALDVSWTDEAGTRHTRTLWP